MDLATLLIVATFVLVVIAVPSAWRALVGRAKARDGRHCFEPATDYDLLGCRSLFNYARATAALAPKTKVGR